MVGSVAECLATTEVGVASHPKPRVVSHEGRRRTWNGIARDATIRDVAPRVGALTVCRMSRRVKVLSVMNGRTVSSETQKASRP